MDTMTQDQNLKMWYIIATQALLELGRPIQLSQQLAKEILEGKWHTLGTMTDDGAFFYKAERRKDESQRHH